MFCVCCSPTCSCWFARVQHKLNWYGADNQSTAGSTETFIFIICRGNNEKLNLHERRLNHTNHRFYITLSTPNVSLYFMTPRVHDPGKYGEKQVGLYCLKLFFKYGLITLDYIVKGSNAYFWSNLESGSKVFFSVFSCYIGIVLNETAWWHSHSIEHFYITRFLKNHVNRDAK